jgi:hypothetical protein
MAIVIPVDKLMRGLRIIATSNPIWVRLRNTSTCYRDRDTGWLIKGNETKKLPLKSTGIPSQSLFACVRAGRFVRIYEPKSIGSKTDDLIDYILRESERLEALEEGLKETV